VRFFHAVMWVAIFGGLGWIVWTGEAATYSGRRGRLFAERLTRISESTKQGLTALLVVGMGFVFATWSIWGKEEGDEEARNWPSHLPSSPPLL
jgi:hypothetical protein